MNNNDGGVTSTLVCIAQLDTTTPNQWRLVFLYNFFQDVGKRRRWQLAHGRSKGVFYFRKQITDTGTVQCRDIAGGGIIKKRQAPLELLDDITAVITIQTIPLVHYQYQRPSFLGNIAGETGILFTDFLLGIEQQQHHVRRIYRLQRLDDTELLDRLADTRTTPHTGGINQGIGSIIAFKRYKDAVAGSARHIKSQHPLFTHHAVDQGGLADIGATNHGNLYPFIIGVFLCIGRLLGEQTHGHIHQRHNATPVDCGNRVRLTHTQREKIRHHGIGINTVCFIHHQQLLFAGTPQCRHNQLVTGGQSVAAVDHKEHQVRFLNRLP